MSIPESYSAEAFNQVPESENRIHSDEVARAYGFRGALVPGVTVSAYLIHPAIQAWGVGWLERGSASVVVKSPVYDREAFRVEVSGASERAYGAELIDARGVRCASAQVDLPDRAGAPPKLRRDPRIGDKSERPIASRPVMEALRVAGLSALRVHWDERAELTRYLRDPGDMPECFRRDGFANPAFLLGVTNWVLSGNVRMSPWLHLQTDSQNFRPIARGSELIVEAAIRDLFAKKGHEFVDVDVNLFDARDEGAYASVRLRAIYKMREVDAAKA